MALSQFPHNMPHTARANSSQQKSVVDGGSPNGSSRESVRASTGVGCAWQGGEPGTVPNGLLKTGSSARRRYWNICLRKDGRRERDVGETENAQMVTATTDFAPRCDMTDSYRRQKSGERDAEMQFTASQRKV